MNLRMLNLSEIKRKKIFYYRLNGKVSYDLMSRVQKYCCSNTFEFKMCSNIH